MNVDEGDKEVADDTNKMHRRADSRNVVAPNDDRQEKELCNRSQHEASEEIQREVLALVNFVLGARRQHADDCEEGKIC